MIGRNMDNTAKDFAQKIISELEKIYHVLLNAPQQQETEPVSPDNTSVKKVHLLNFRPALHKP